MSETVTAGVTPMRERAAEEIRVLLARRRMSASELARRIGQTQPYLSRRLTGDVALDVDDLDKIAQVMGVEPAALLGWGPTPMYRTPPRKPRSRRPQDNRPTTASTTMRRPKMLRNVA